MKIATLLPSATEIVCALGLGDRLVGVSHECDWPPGVQELPVLTRSRIPPGLPSAEIDAIVTAELEASEALYGIDAALLEALAPDLVVTQALCDVCAVSGNEVARVVGSLPRAPRVVNLEPGCLADVLRTVQLVAAAAGCPERGEALLASLEGRIEAVAARSRTLAPRQRPRVAALDWLDPPFSGGHWVPELIALAGGEPCFGPPGEPSRRLDEAALAAARPDVLVIALCGFDEARSLVDAGDFLAGPHWRALAGGRPVRVLLIDGNAYFSRPGPRLVDSLEILAHALHPALHPRAEGLPPPRWLGTGAAA